MLQRPSAIAFVFLLAGCGPQEAQPTIAELVADPARFHEKVVVIEGRATDSYGMLSSGVFVFEDDTGDVNVLTSHGLPAEGSRFTVRGSVITGVTVAGRRFGTAIREQERIYERESGSR